MAFADLVANLNLNITNFSSNLSRASRQMRNFANNMQQSYGIAAAALNKHNLHLKDTVRIVHGIVIAQTFYQTAGAITDATRALWDFNVALDYMNVTYSALFGDVKVAEDFMAVLQEHSVETIFDYQNLADASKKLLAYGIEYENLMFIMEGLTNLGAMSGDSAALDRIALALGQIYTKGKLSAEEMRQLANAYIPITEILQDKFGLTGEHLKRVGDLNLPASDVINAIVDYANENFGSVGDAAMYTITGLQNRIVDTLKVVGAQMLKPITTAYKSFLAYMSRGLEAIRSEFEAGGVGGIFEYLVPDPDTQQVIRQFIANVKNLLMSLISIGSVAGQIFGNFASVLVTAFNIVSPMVVGFINVLTSLLNAMLQTRSGALVLRIALIAAAGAFVVLKAQAVAALVITAVTKAVINLSKALMLLAGIISRHPILALIAGVTLSLIGVSAASNSANKSISGLFDTLSGVGGGSSSGDVLQEVKQDLVDSADAADQFNNRLDGATDSANNLSNAIGGAGKAADKADKKLAGLLSFDEVFKLNEPKDSSSGSGGAGAGLLGDLENLAAGFGGLGESLIPDIPDFTEYIDNFTDGLFGGLKKGFFEKLASAGLGALIGGGIGAVIGGLLGGPAGAALGAKIGAFAGGVVGLLWEAFDGAISNTINGAIAGIAAAIGRSFGSTFGAVMSTFINTGSFAGFFKSLGQIFTATGLKAIAKGGVIGAAVGFVVDGVAHLLWGSLEDRFDGANAETAKVGQTIGSVIGAIIGGLLGGPPGAIIGSAIGTFAGGFAGLFWEPIAEYFDPENNVLTAFFVETGYKLGEWATETLHGLTEWWRESRSGFSTWWADTKTGFSTWWSDTKAGFGSWLADTVATFSDWDSINGNTLGDWWKRTKDGFTTWADDTIKKVDEWSGGTLLKFLNWAGNTKAEFDTWKSDTKTKFNTWKSDLLGIIGGWVTDTLASIGQWILNVNKKWEEFSAGAARIFEGVLIAIGKAFADGFVDIANAIGNFFGVENLWNIIKDGITAFTNKIAKWWEGITEVFSGEIEAKPTVNVNATAKPSAPTRGSGGPTASMIGHASGGVFNREHIARFAEHNKAEAIIPLENNRAMRPFVDAVSNGIISSLAPVLASGNPNNSNNLPPLYVGTLIADDRGLKQLYKKFELIQLQENDRRGTPTHA